MTHPIYVGRGRRFARRALLLSCALSAGSIASGMVLATPATAQSPAQQPAPPRDYNLDANGVDLVTGKLYLPSTDLTIGRGDAGLSYSRNQRALGYDDQYDTALNIDSSTITVSIGSLTDTFVNLGGGSTSGTGAMLSLVDGLYVYTNNKGVRYTFDPAVKSEQYKSAQQRVTNIDYPNGKKIIIRYNAGHIDGCDEFGCNGTSFFYSRPVAVESNDGFRLSIKYLTDELRGPPETGFQTERFMTVASVTATNDAQEHCTTSTCPTAGTTWASAQYAWNAGDTQETHTDALGRATVTTFDAAGRITGVRLPGETTNVATIGYDAGSRVATVTTGIGAWSYGYADNGNIRTTTVTSPTGLQRVATTDLSLGKIVSDRMGSGGTTTYEYDAETRLTKTTAPEGNSTVYYYGPLDDIIQSVSTSKDGMAVLSTASVFPGNCNNVVTCHLPTSTSDAKGDVTNYTYDPVHGGVLSVKRPAPTPGTARPETRFSYQQLYAWFKDAGGALVQAASPIWKLIAVSECAIGEAPACVGTAAETRTEIAYGTPGTPNNLLPTSITVRAGDNSISSTRTISYDKYGNVIAVDGPLPGSDDTSTMRYNLARETVGAISPDPDGAGPLKRRATRVGRDPAGRVITTEVGTVTGVSDAEWSAFSSLQTLTSSFNSTTRLKTQDTFTAGGSTRRLVQYGYDAEGRAKCTAVRIGLAASANPCQQLGDATSGYDQLTETIYGSDGRVAKRRQGGVDTALATYTSNGQIATLTDGENNRTTYEYDGFDRLSKTRYPIATKGAQASSTTDYEQLGYDYNGVVTSRRLRDGSSIGYGYDALSRLTSKDLPGTELDVVYGYDLLSRPTLAQTSAQTLSFGYDALGRNLTQVGPLGTMSAQFDAAGRRIRLTWPDSFYVTYDHLVTGEMRAISEAGATTGPGVLATFGYDDLGQRTSLSRGNGTSTGYTYDAVSQLSTLTQDIAGVGSDLTLGFSHNPIGQITAATRSNDAYAWNGHYNRTTPYGTNGLNQATSVGIAAIDHDARGNTMSIGSAGYTYSAENLLLTGPSSTSLIYDPLARLYQIGQSATTRFLYDGLEMVGEYDGSNTLQRRNVFGPGSDEALVWYEGAGTGDRRWLYADERGSVIAVSNGAGTTLATNAYDEYGAPALNNVGRFGYTGQAWLPELGLWYYKARVYSPKLGRFMQADPIGYDAGLNLYNYVGSDPVNFTDPSGLYCEGGSGGNADAGREACERSGGLYAEDVVVTAPRFVNAGGSGGVIGGGPFGSGGGITADPILTPIPVILNLPQNTQPEQPRCIKPTDGPVDFTGGGLDLVLGAGGGFGVYKFSIPSTGASGYVASGAFLGGLGGSFGVTKGRVNNFGNFTGFGYRAEFSTPIPAVGGEVIFGNDGKAAGGAASLAAGGGLYGGRTKTRVLSSNIPVCPN